MAADPVFASTPKTAAGLIPGTAATSGTMRTAPDQITIIVTAGSSGSKIEELTFQGVGTTVAGVVCVFAYDGSTYNLYDEVAITAVTPSTTVTAFRSQRYYTNFWLPSGWSLRVTNGVAGNVSLVKVTAMYLDV